MQVWGAPMHHGEELAGKSFGSQMATKCTSNLCKEIEGNNQPFSKNHQDFLIIK